VLVNPADSVTEQFAKPRPSSAIQLPTGKAQPVGTPTVFAEQRRLAQIISLLTTGGQLVLVSAAIALIRAASWVVPARRLSVGGRPRRALAALTIGVVGAVAATGYYVHRGAAQPEDAQTMRSPDAANRLIAVPALSREQGSEIAQVPNLQPDQDGTTELSSVDSPPIASPQQEADTPNDVGNGSNSSTDEQSSQRAAADDPSSVPAPAEPIAAPPLLKPVRQAPAKPIASFPASPSEPKSRSSSVPDVRAMDAPPGADSKSGSQACSEAKSALGLCDSATGEPSTNPRAAERNGVETIGTTAAAGGSAQMSGRTPLPGGRSPGSDPASGSRRKGIAPDEQTSSSCAEPVAAFGLCPQTTAPKH
jgi:hypothetical protein